MQWWRSLPRFPICQSHRRGFTLSKGCFLKGSQGQKQRGPHSETNPICSISSRCPLPPFHTRPPLLEEGIALLCSAAEESDLQSSEKPLGRFPMGRLGVALSRPSKNIAHRNLKPGSPNQPTDPAPYARFGLLESRHEGCFLCHGRSSSHF